MGVCLGRPVQRADSLSPSLQQPSSSSSTNGAQAAGNTHLESRLSSQFSLLSLEQHFLPHSPFDGDVGKLLVACLARISAEAARRKHEVATAAEEASQNGEEKRDDFFSFFFFQEAEEKLCALGTAMERVNILANALRLAAEQPELQEGGGEMAKLLKDNAGGLRETVENHLKKFILHQTPFSPTPTIAIVSLPQSNDSSFHGGTVTTQETRASGDSRLPPSPAEPQQQPTAPASHQFTSENLISLLQHLDEIIVLVEQAHRNLNKVLLLAFLHLRPSTTSPSTVTATTTTTAASPTHQHHSTPPPLQPSLDSQSPLLASSLLPTSMSISATTPPPPPPAPPPPLYEHVSPRSPPSPSYTLFLETLRRQLPSSILRTREVQAHLQLYVPIKFALREPPVKSFEEHDVEAFIHALLVGKLEQIGSSSSVQPSTEATAAPLPSNPLTSFDSHTIPDVPTISIVGSPSLPIGDGAASNVRAAYSSLLPSATFPSSPLVRNSAVGSELHPHQHPQQTSTSSPLDLAAATTPSKLASNTTTTTSHRQKADDLFSRLEELLTPTRTPLEMMSRSPRTTTATTSTTATFAATFSSQPISAVQPTVTSTASRISLVQGEGGSGKTMLGRRLMQLFEGMQEKISSSPSSLSSTPRLPIFLDPSRLQDLGQSRTSQDDFLLDCIIDSFQSLSSSPASLSSTHSLRQQIHSETLDRLRQEQFVFFLDGIEQLSPSITSLLQLCDVSQWPNSVFVFTCRPGHFKADVELAEFFCASTLVNTAFEDEDGGRFSSIGNDHPIFQLNKPDGGGDGDDDDDGGPTTLSKSSAQPPSTMDSSTVNPTSAPTTTSPRPRGIQYLNLKERLKEIFLLPFSKSQLAEFQRKFFSMQAACDCGVKSLIHPHWSVQEYEDAAKAVVSSGEVYQLSAFMSNPFMASVILTVLPQLASSHRLAPKNLASDSGIEVSSGGPSKSTQWRLECSILEVAECKSSRVFPSLQHSELLALYCHGIIQHGIQAHTFHSHARSQQLFLGKEEHAIVRDIFNFCGDLAFHLLNSDSQELSCPAVKEIYRSSVKGDAVDEGAEEKAFTLGKELDFIINVLLNGKLEPSPSPPGSFDSEAASLSNFPNAILCLSSGEAETQPNYAFANNNVRDFFIAHHIMHGTGMLKMMTAASSSTSHPLHTATLPQQPQPSGSVSTLDNLLHQGSFTHPDLHLGRKLLSRNVIHYCSHMIDPMVQHYILGLSSTHHSIIQAASLALWDIVQASRSLAARASIEQRRAAGTAASNALMIFIAAGMHFDGCDFSNATFSIPPPQQQSLSLQDTMDATSTTQSSNEVAAPARHTPDFSGGKFTNCNFQHCDLSLATLQGCDFSGAKLDHAEMHNISLNQFPAFLGHTDAVQSVCCTPDSQFVISASDDKTVKIWSMTTGRLLTTLEGHAASVNCVCISADGRFIVSAGNDSYINIWSKVVDGGRGDTDEKWKMLRQCKGQTISYHAANSSTDSGDVVTSLCISPSGNFIFSGSSDECIHAWWLRSGNYVFSFLGHTDIVTSICCSPDNALLISGSEDCSVRIWSIASTEQELQLDGHTGPIVSVCVTADGAQVVSSSNDNTVRIWSLHTGEQLRSFSCDANSICLSPTGKYIVAGLLSGDVRVWHLESGQVDSYFYQRRHGIEGHEKAIFSVCMSLDGQFLITGSADKSVRIWPMSKSALDAYALSSSNALTSTLKYHRGAITCVGIAGSGNSSNSSDCVVSGSTDGTLCVWSLTTGNILSKCKGHEDAVLCLCFAPSSGDGARVGYHDQSHPHPTVTNIGNDIISGSKDGTVRVWSLTSGKQIRQLDGHRGFINCVRATPCGKKVVSGSSDKTIRVWTLGLGEALLRIDVGFAVEDLCITIDGQFVFSACPTATADHAALTLWSLYNKKMMRHFGHGNGSTTDTTAAAASCAIASSHTEFSSLGDIFPTTHFDPKILAAQHLVSGHRDGVVRIWAIDSGKLVSELPPQFVGGAVSSSTTPLLSSRESPVSHGDVTSIAVSEGGKYILAATRDRIVRVWCAESGRQVLQLSGHLGVVRSVCTSSSTTSAEPIMDFVVTGSDDRKLRIWRIDHGKGSEAADKRSGPGTLSASSFAPPTTGMAARLLHSIGRNSSTTFAQCTFVGLEAGPLTHRLIQQQQLPLPL